MNIYREILKSGCNVKTYWLNDLKTFDNEFEVNPEFTSLLTDFCSYQPVKGPVWLSVVIRDNDILCKEAIMRTRILNDEELAGVEAKKELLFEIDKEILNRMISLGDINKEGDVESRLSGYSKKFNYVLVPSNKEVDIHKYNLGVELDVNIKIIKLDLLNELNKLVYIYKGTNILDCGLVYHPYTFIKTTDGKSGFRYAVIDKMTGSDSYFLTRTIV